MTVVPRPDSGMVTITAEEGGRITFLLNGDVGHQAPVGGWETTDRIGQQPAAWWRQQPLATLTLPLALHVQATGSGIERQLEVLKALGAPSAVDGDPPPPVQVVGDVPTSPATLWRIDSIELGPCLYHPDAPTVLMVQELSVALTELAPSATVTRASARSARTKKGKRKARTVKARKNDTVRAIAIRYLGNSTDYKLIRQWNPKLKRTDPDARLKAGTKVVLR